MNRPSVAPANHKRGDRGDLELTMCFYRFNSLLVLGQVIPKTLEMVGVPACMVLRMN